MLRKVTRLGCNWTAYIAAYVLVGTCICQTQHVLGICLATSSALAAQSSQLETLWGLTSRRSIDLRGVHGRRLLNSRRNDGCITSLRVTWNHVLTTQQNDGYWQDDLDRRPTLAYSKLMGFSPRLAKSYSAM